MTVQEEDPTALAVVEDQKVDDLKDANPTLRMGEPLDIQLPDLELVDDLKVHHRDFPEGKGCYTVLHHQHLSKSVMSGAFQSMSSTGGITRYEGCFQGDPHNDGPVPNGPGVRDIDGYVYAGEFKDGLPHGQGEWKSPEGTESFLGEWKRGKKHGFGLMKFANGDVYEGDWADGKFQDRGKYTYANGDEFMGLWDKGIKTSGTFYYKDGRISARKWQNGRLVSSQDYDAKKKSYQPTMTDVQVHDPARTVYGQQTIFSGDPMMSPSGVRVGLR